MYFVSLSVVTMLLATELFRRVSPYTPRDVVFVHPEGQAAAIPVRAFLMLVATIVAISLHTNWWRRSAVWAHLVGGILLICFVVDVAAYLAHESGLFAPPVVGQQLASSLATLVMFPFVIMRHANLPTPVDLPPVIGIRWHAWPRLVLPLVAAFVLAAWVEQTAPITTTFMREWALLGGVGPGIFLVQQLFALFTAGIGLLLIRRSRRATFAPPLAVMIPAHNEGHDIAVTIAALDRAAARYAAPVHVYVIDNVSTDDTRYAAESALAECTHCTGEVRYCAEPGKAIALNYALSIIHEEFVVRIDADTVIGPNCLDVTLRHFANPKVAAVGGMPRPPRVKTFFDRARMVEVLLKHGFFQVSLMGFDGILGEPGMFVVYRRRAVLETGGIVQGMNGEDTDICLRMSSQGYLSLVEPTAVYLSEVPQSWAHMREQRIRWFRSIFHIAAHNRRAMLDRSSMAGAVVLPLQLANAVRRAMLVPLLLFGLLIFGLFEASYPGLREPRLWAVFLGLPMLVAVGVCLARRPRAVLYIPEYLVFRMVRSYFTLAAILSLNYPPLHPGARWRARKRASTAVRGAIPRATPADRVPEVT